MASTRKYRNVAETGRAALVIDDRLHPDMVFTWGVEPGSTGMSRRETTGERSVDL